MPQRYAEKEKKPDQAMSQDYNKTLNLPKTDFPMRGNLPKREPDTLQKWEDENLYEQMIAAADAGLCLTVQAACCFQISTE